MKKSSSGRLPILRPALNSATALETLKAQGFRITKVRRALLELFSKTKHPMSVPELLPALAKKSLPVNKTTVYRELEFLLTNKVIIELDLLDGAKRYELLQPDHHHHHLVCTKCGMIECVEMNHDLDEIEARIATNHKFKVSSHVLEFFGLCEKCN